MAVTVVKYPAFLLIWPHTQVWLKRIVLKTIRPRDRCEGSNPSAVAMKKIVKILPALCMLSFSTDSLLLRGNVDFQYENSLPMQSEEIQKQYIELYALNDAKVFSLPSYTSSIVRTIPKGDSILIYDEITGQNYENYFVSDIGYILHEDLVYSKDIIFYPEERLYYAASGAIAVDYPGNDGNMVAEYAQNDKLYTIGYNEFGYYQLKDGYYINEEYLMSTPVVYYSGSATISPASGVYFYGGRKETYYSSRVLYHYKTPQWHVDGEGFYHDANGYYVVAASDMAQGTVFNCSKGSCIVLDSGCAPGVTDYYVNW